MSRSDWPGLPVVIFTSSLDKRDCEKSPAEGTGTFVVKPIGYDEFHEAMVNLVNDYVQGFDRENAEQR